MQTKIDKCAEHFKPHDINQVDINFKKILLPTDGSPSAIRATRVAIGLAKALNANVLAVFVINNDIAKMSEIVDDSKQYFGGVHPTEAGLAVAKEMGKENNVVVDTTVLRGSIARNILKVADAEKVHLIIMGESGRIPTNRIPLGSVTETVLRLSNFPVLVVKNN